MKEVSVEINFYEGSEEVLAQFEVDGEYQILTFDDLMVHIPRLNVADIQFVWLDVFGDYVVGFMTIGDGRGTRVFGWSLNDEELVHVSYAPYVQKILLEDNMLYMLCDVDRNGDNRHLEVNSCEFGVLDQDYVYDNVFFRLEPEFDEYDNEDYWIKKDGRIVTAGYKDMSGTCHV